MTELDTYMKNLGFAYKELFNAIEYKNNETSQTLTIFKDTFYLPKAHICVENISGFTVNELKMILDKCSELNGGQNEI